MSVGVMEDYKLRDLRASHTLEKKCGDHPHFGWVATLTRYFGKKVHFICSLFYL